MQVSAQPDGCRQSRAAGARWLLPPAISPSPAVPHGLGAWLDARAAPSTASEVLQSTSAAAGFFTGGGQCHLLNAAAGKARAPGLVFAPPKSAARSSRQILDISLLADPKIKVALCLFTQKKKNPKTFCPGSPNTAISLENIRPHFELSCVKELLSLP